MLQQTRVEAVISLTIIALCWCFQRMFTHWPPRRRKLCSKPGRVLGITAGRATCTKPPRSVSQTMGGIFPARFPNTYEAQRDLPGIGDYTAGAIASIAFGDPCACHRRQCEACYIQAFGHTREYVNQPAVIRAELREASDARPSLPIRAAVRLQSGT